MCETNAHAHRVYRAEFDALYMAETVFSNIHQARGFLDEILADPWFRARYRLRRVTLRHRRVQDSAVAYPERGLICLPKWAQKDWVVLHELAHLLEPTTWHGPEFCDTFSKLVERYMNPIAARELRAHYRLNKVPVRRAA